MIRIINGDQCVILDNARDHVCLGSSVEGRSPETEEPKHTWSSALSRIMHVVERDYPSYTSCASA